MRKAVAIPYVIALILGVAVIGLLGYWFFAQGNKAVTTGGQIDCAAVRFNYCNGFAEWDDKCPNKPQKDTSGKCPETISTTPPTPPGGTPGNECTGSGRINCDDTGTKIGRCENGRIVGC